MMSCIGQSRAHTQTVDFQPYEIPFSCMTTKAGDDLQVQTFSKKTLGTRVFYLVE